MTITMKSVITAAVLILCFNAARAAEPNLEGFEPGTPFIEAEITQKVQMAHHPADCTASPNVFTLHDVEFSNVNITCKLDVSGLPLLGVTSTPTAIPPSLIFSILYVFIIDRFPPQANAISDINASVDFIKKKFGVDKPSTTACPLLMFLAAPGPLDPCYQWTLKNGAFLEFQAQIRPRGVAGELALGPPEWLWNKFVEKIPQQAAPPPQNSQLQDCLAKNPYYAGCPIENQYCSEQNHYLIYRRQCFYLYGDEQQKKTCGVVGGC